MELRDVKITFQVETLLLYMRSGLRVECLGKAKSLKSKKENEDKKIKDMPRGGSDEFTSVCIGPLT